MTKYCAHLHHTLAALKGYFPVSLVAPLSNSEQINHTYTKSTLKHIHHHYAPSVTSTHTTHIISLTAPTYGPHCHPWICGQSDWWARSDMIGLPPQKQGSRKWVDNNTSLFHHRIMAWTWILSVHLFSYSDKYCSIHYFNQKFVVLHLVD